MKNILILIVLIIPIHTFAQTNMVDLNSVIQGRLDAGYKVTFVADSMIKIASSDKNFVRLYDIRQNPMPITSDMQIIDLTKANPDDYKNLFIRTKMFPVSGSMGYPLEIADFDNDGRIEFAGSYGWYKLGNSKTAVYELDSLNDFVKEKIYPDSEIVQSPISASDVDNDGIPDYNFRGMQYFLNYQSPAPGVFPDSSRFVYQTWDKEGYVSSETFGSFDNDIFTDLLHTGADTVDGGFHYKIYVAEFDPQIFNFKRVFSFFPKNPQEYLSGVSVGDLDGDGSEEFVTGSVWGHLFFFENSGDNSYQLIYRDTVSAANMYVNVRTHDMDGNGKDEFILGGSYWTDPGGMVFYWFESDGDNHYKIIRKFVVAGPDPLGYSEAWAYDVNNDGYDDLVLHYSHYVAILTWNRSTQQFDLLYMSPWTYEVESINMYDTYKKGRLDLYVSVTEYDHNPVERTYLFENDFVTGLKPQKTKIPTGFSLDLSYPNPFNGTTTIPFKLEKPGVVELYMVDISGRRVKSLIRHKKFGRGSHTVRWNGTKDNGKEAASGIYIVVLQNGNIKQSRKILLIK